MNEQINEMTKDYKLCYPCEMFGGYIDDDGNLCGDICCIDGSDCTKCGVSTDLAKSLIKHGYQRVDEDKIVLTESEYVELIDAKAELIKLKSQTVSDIRKEMATDFYRELKQYRHFVEHDGQKADMVFFSHIEDLVKQHGVEVEQ